MRVPSPPIALFLILHLLYTTSSIGSQQCDTLGPRVDCGSVGITAEQCRAQGCCWAPADFGPEAPHVDIPWCFTQNSGFSSYSLDQLHHPVPLNSSSIDTDATALPLERNSNAAHVLVQGTLKLDEGTQPELGPELNPLKVEVIGEEYDTIRVRITDVDEQRWKVPRDLFRPPSGAASKDIKSPFSQRNAKKSLLYNLDYKEVPFSLEVVRSSNGQAVFNSTDLRLIFKDQYIELSTWLDPAALVFGAGERTTDTLHLQRTGLPLAIWSRDVPSSTYMQNLYGSHPFVISLHPDGTACGYLMLNSNAMDVVPAPDKLTFRLTGGVIDLYIFLGPTPLDVMQQVTRVIGRPAMMPYWSLGWHQSKYGYKSVWELEQVVEGYAAAGIPLEVMWSDIDHMDGWRDFTFDPINYPVPKMRRFVDQLHAVGKKWVPIIDPGIKVDPGYAAYDEGMKRNVFIQGINGNEPYLGWVWPAASYYPDFFNPVTREYFEEMLKAHRQTFVPWSGIWIDMNEASNFCSGEACTFKTPTPQNATRLRDDPPWVCGLQCPDIFDSLTPTQQALLRPPYRITNGLNSQIPLGAKGISVVATHYDGVPHYNRHNLFSLAQAQTVYDTVAKITGKRPFVLTRSTFSGSGEYAAHWTGDNSATWTDMRRSLVGVMNSGLFGMPMAGADVCGFSGDTTEELCARWVALAAIAYPFARSHSDLHASYQEPYRWPMVAEVARLTLNLRYALLPYLYTTLAEAHMTGAPMVRPLWMNFPEQGAVHAVDRQVMMGSALLVSPVLEQGAGSVEAYFPQGMIWYDLWNLGSYIDTATEGKWVTLPLEMSDRPVGVHIKGGSIVPMQHSAMTTAAVKHSPMKIVVALPEIINKTTIRARARTITNKEVKNNVTASGWVYNDDGESLQPGEDDPSTSFPSPYACSKLTMTAAVLPGQGGEVTLEISGGRSRADTLEVDKNEWPVLGGVQVLGWALPVEGVEVDWAGGGAAMAVAGDKVRTGSYLDVDLEGLEGKLRYGSKVVIRWRGGRDILAV